MKRVLVILLMLFAAADLLSAAASSRESDFASILGPGGAVFSAPGTDTKKVEDKVADALDWLESRKNALAKENNQTQSNSSSYNSTADNNSIISPPGNSSPLNSSDDQKVDADRIDGNSPAGPQNAGSSSKGKFNGYYGITASRHEIGKSGINSHMFLSGTFEMDKTVKFQDQGID